MKISPRAEIVIALVILALLMVGMTFFVIVPQIGAMAEQDGKLTVANQDIQSAQNLLAQRQSSKARASQTQVDLMNLENEVPDDPQLPSLIIELQNAANEAGLDFIKISPTLPVVRSGYSAVPIGVELDGRWADCIDYVRRLETLDRQVRVLSLRIVPLVDPATSVEATGSANRNPPTDLKAALTIEAYTIGSVGASTTVVPGAPSSGGIQ